MLNGHAQFLTSMRIGGIELGLFIVLAMTTRPVIDTLAWGFAALIHWVVELRLFTGGDTMTKELEIRNLGKQYELLQQLDQ